MTAPYISGPDWERTIFGYASFDFPRPRYIPTWEDAIEEEAANQQKYNWNPKAPNTPEGQMLFRAVQTRLKKRFREHLELYCAVGSSLDWDYGTDGFFRIGKYVVAIDLTASRAKERVSAESDIVVVLAQHVLGTKIGTPCQRIAQFFNTGLRGVTFESPNIVSTIQPTQPTGGGL